MPTEEAGDAPSVRDHKGAWRPVPAVLTGCYLLATAGCGSANLSHRPETHRPRRPVHLRAGRSEPGPGQGGAAPQHARRAARWTSPSRTSRTSLSARASGTTSSTRRAGRVARRDTAVQQAAPGTTRRCRARARRPGRAASPARAAAGRASSRSPCSISERRRAGRSRERAGYTRRRRRDPPPRCFRARRGSRLLRARATRRARAPAPARLRMLRSRPAADSPDAMICSFECTFCRACAETAPRGALPELRRRARAAAGPPRRPARALSGVDRARVQARRLPSRGVAGAEARMTGDVKVISGTAHPGLAQDVCRHLGIPVCRSTVVRFSNENMLVQIEENVREADVFVIQPSCPPVSDGIIELLITIDALRHASAGRITAVLPYFPYARSDKKDRPRISITARLMADLLADRGGEPGPDDGPPLAAGAGVLPHPGRPAAGRAHPLRLPAPEPRPRRTTSWWPATWASRRRWSTTRPA